MRAIGYGRCSTQEQAKNGTSIETQRAKTEQWAQAHECEFVWLADEGVSGGVPPQDRPKFRAALALLDAREADALVFTRIDRAGRSVRDIADLLIHAEENGWRVVITEMGVDTGTAMGKAMVHVAAAFAELERQFLKERTREGLATRRSQGVVLGRPPSTPGHVIARVQREWTAGRTLTEIAYDLNTDGVPTARGGKRWEPATVRALLKRNGAEILSAEVRAVAADLIDPPKENY